MRMKNTIHRFFFSESDPAPLGIFRILIGLFIGVTWFALYPNWDIYYGPAGLRPEPVHPSLESLFVMSENWIPIYIFWWIGIISSVAFTLGWKTRVFTIILFFLQSSMNLANSMMVNGEDLVVRMLLFCSIFAPLGKAFSLDSIHPKNNTHSDSFPIWPLRMMQINIALIYLFSLPSKLLSDISWLNGEAIYWVMMTSTWNRWSWQDWFYNGILSKVLTYSTVIIEGGFPFLIWFKKTRIPVLFAITIFHLGLGIGLKNVSFFSFSMVCAFSLFLPAASIRRCLPQAVGDKFAYTCSNQITKPITELEA